MNLYRAIFLSVNLFFLSSSAFTQPEIADDSKLLGKWVNKDTGVLIATDHITRLYKTDGKWEYTYFASNEFSFIDTAMKWTDNSLYTWTASSYTARREYLKNGSERSIEAVDFKFIKIDLIDNNTIRLSISPTCTVNKENQSPFMVVTADMKKDILKNDQYSSIILKRLP